MQPLIIAIEENETLLDDTLEKLGIQAVCILILLQTYLDLNSICLG